jgi:hypothetical protein
LHGIIVMTASTREHMKQPSAAAQGRAQIAEGFDIFRRGLEAKQKEFEALKKKVDDDIRRGAKLTEHKLPL